MKPCHTHPSHHSYPGIARIDRTFMQVIGLLRTIFSPARWSYGADCAGMAPVSVDGRIVLMAVAVQRATAMTGLCRVRNKFQLPAGRGRDHAGAKFGA